ncbi:hypothetical protein LXL04_027634 [Taraxacum kok-saghyz]
MELELLASAAESISPMERFDCNALIVLAVGSSEEVYKTVDDGPLDFDSWTSLISKIEKNYQENIKAISWVYESFLSRFPLCHEYWKRYADHMARFSTMEKAVEIYESAVESATYSVGFWVDYCSFCMLAFEDPNDVRRVFERGLSYVGKDFLSYKLWDLYIRFELSQQQWSLLAHILIRALKFPTKSLHKYYDNFKEFAAFVEEDMSHSKSRHLEPYEDDSNIEFATSHDKVLYTIKKLQDSSSVELRSKSLNKLINIGEGYYRKSCKLHEEIDYFENYIERDFFHVGPLDDEELENWHNYLDFIEKQEDFDWAVKLYERCLIPCANYPEFWMRYVEFMESKGGRELASFALERATKVFLKNVSEVHIFNARFREKIGDIEGARAAFQNCDTNSDSSFIEIAIKEANMEKRLGNLATALDVYKKALKTAAEREKMHIIPILYIHFFRLKYLITGSADVAMNLLLSGVQQVPHSKLLLEELINFAMMQQGSRHLKVLDRIMATAITCGSNDRSEGLSYKDREDLSNLYLKLVDQCGTTLDIRKAWNRHVKSFPNRIRTTTTLHKRPSNNLKQLTETIPRIDHIAPTSPNNFSNSENQAVEKQQELKEPEVVLSEQNELQISQIHDPIIPDKVEDTPPSAASPAAGATTNHREPESSPHQQVVTQNGESVNVMEAKNAVTNSGYYVESSEGQAYNNQMWQYHQYQYQNQQQWLQMSQQGYVNVHQPQEYVPPPHQQQQQYQMYQQYWYQMYQQQQQQVQHYHQGQGMMMPPNTGFDPYTQNVGATSGPTNIAPP